MEIKGSGPSVPLQPSDHSPAAGRSDADAPARSLLSAAQEQALLALRDRDLSFDPHARRALTNDLTGVGGYLTQGWLPDDSNRDGPVKLLWHDATSPEGVAWDTTNLTLEPDAQVIGMRNTDGGADSYFVCRPDQQDADAPPNFFIVCIESGRRTGMYEIYVSPPCSWQAFLDHFE
ncbi:hypothetical protein [Stenotrophomonas sp.]|uniref:hypothetical protein n=1 Tax=Stenotrophomonas sp. TaxID=69392 RepID=UPI0028A014B6|nr:hypothetical protein [Stenotrophomonas sp.]